MKTLSKYRILWVDFFLDHLFIIRLSLRNGQKRDAWARYGKDVSSLALSECTSLPGPPSAHQPSRCTGSSTGFGKSNVLPCKCPTCVSAFI